MRLLVVPLLVVCGYASMHAAEAPPRVPPPPVEPLPPIFAPKAPPAKKAPPRRTSTPPGATPSRRAISPEMSAKLSALAREIAPAPTGRVEGTAAATTAGEGSDAVLLDPFYVEEAKVPEFKERELLTRAGKLAEALKRYPGLKLGTIPLGNNQVARDMLEDAYRKERVEEMKELSGLLSVEKGAVPPELRKTMDETRAGVLRPRDEKLFPDREKR